jgi:hypothetical protein
VERERRKNHSVRVDFRTGALRHDAFRGGASPAMMDQANVVDILHDDGTIAMYAHLHWDSIQVHIGQHVDRGQYLANSGSTGFSTGPHLFRGDPQCWLQSCLGARGVRRPLGDCGYAGNDGLVDGVLMRRAASPPT